MRRVVLPARRRENETKAQAPQVEMEVIFVLEQYADLVVATGGVAVFLASLVFIRPLNAPECEALSKSLPPSWSLPRSIARTLSAT